MKKILIASLSLLLTSSILVSCGKSTKGKFSNDWNVVEYAHNATIVDDNEKKIVSENASSSIYVETVKTILNGETASDITNKGVVKKYTFKIEKDGNWSSLFIFETSKTDDTGIKTIVLTSRQESGTWNFVTKNKTGEFKKNERVLFNVLSNKEDVKTTIIVGNESNSTSTNSFNNFLVGDYTKIYTITDSKNKSLSLEREFNTLNNTNSNGYNYIVSEQGLTTIVLEEGGSDE